MHRTFKSQVFVFKTLNQNLRLIFVNYQVSLVLYKTLILLYLGHKKRDVLSNSIVDKSWAIIAQDNNFNFLIYTFIPDQFGNSIAEINRVDMM